MITVDNEVNMQHHHIYDNKGGDGTFAPLVPESIPMGWLLDALPVFLLKVSDFLKLVGLLEAP